MWERSRSLAQQVYLRMLATAHGWGRLPGGRFKANRPNRRSRRCGHQDRGTYVLQLQILAVGSFSRAGANAFTSRHGNHRSP